MKPKTGTRHTHLFCVTRSEREANLRESESPPSRSKARKEREKGLSFGLWKRRGGKRRAKTGLPLWMLGWGVDFLRAEMNRLLALLFHQGVLDEQFLQLQQLQDESSPNFVSEVITIYFSESEKLLRNLRMLLMDRELSDYKKMEIHLNQMMGSSSSIGAKRVRNVCVAFRAASEQSNHAGCLRALELLEHEYCYLKNKLHELFQIEQQRALASGVRYPAQHD